MKIALLGAESTGKTQLAAGLAAHLRGQGRSVAVVPEVLREWCARERRPPRPEEQMPIAQEQERRVDAAAAEAGLVIADTTALMVAIYSGMLFEDGELYRFALARQRRYGLTLLTGLDLPWVADGLHRSGPQDRAAVDALVRAGLERAGVTYRVIYGQGPERLSHALDAIGFAAHRASASPPAPAPGPQPPSAVWACGKCGDAQCEHRLFSRLRIRTGKADG